MIDHVPTLDELCSNWAIGDAMREYAKSRIVMTGLKEELLELADQFGRPMRRTEILLKIAATNCAREL